MQCATENQQSADMSFLQNVIYIKIVFQTCFKVNLMHYETIYKRNTTRCSDDATTARMMERKPHFTRLFHGRKSDV